MCLLFVVCCLLFVVCCLLYLCVYDFMTTKENELCNVFLFVSEWIDRSILIADCCCLHDCLQESSRTVHRMDWPKEPIIGGSLRRNVYKMLRIGWIGRKNQGVSNGRHKSTSSFVDLLTFPENSIKYTT